ncbi:MAG TPA: YegS/Rv2252/BmrU family lipid kinase [Acholeplasmataceae bacterium]|nr:YegS/Rv2252/BmrU family lipid kinase [Acholeplasmataceae bacterium]
MNYLLMYNPVSGRSNFKINLPLIQKIFDKSHHTLTIYESKAAKDLEKVAFEQAKNYDVYLVAGGDGTANEVLNGVMRSPIKPALGLLPSGTANDTAAILGVNKNIRRSLKIYMTEVPVLIDINKINDQYFFYTAASGLLTRVSYDISRRHIKKYGYLAYLIAAMKDLSNEYRYPVRVTHDGITESMECAMILGLSSNRVGGMRLINFSESHLNDGLFELRLFKRAKSFWRLRLLSSFIRGGKKLREDLHIASNKFVIETSSNVDWNADGEFACKGSVTIETFKEALSIYAHPKVKKKCFMPK